jgi:hypothetical protein
MIRTEIRRGVAGGPAAVDTREPARDGIESA